MLRQFLTGQEGSQILQRRRNQCAVFQTLGAGLGLPYLLCICEDLAENRSVGGKRSIYSFFHFCAFHKLDVAVWNCFFSNCRFYDAKFFNKCCALFNISVDKFCGCLEFVKECADRILRITIDTDREGGIGIDDCERVNRAVDPILDETDPIDTSYYLQVSSPGIERDITLPWHVTACAGERVEVKLFAPVEGSRKYDGILLGFEGGETDPARKILVDIGEKTLAFEYESVSKIKTLFDFDSI